MTDLGVDLDAMRAMVSSATWGRGQSYAERGFVTLVTVADGRVVARVQGTETYRCTLAGDDLLDMSCTCPAFQDHPGPCKHLVATALVLAERPADSAPPPTERIRQFLRGMPSERLVELLVGLAEADSNLEARLLLQADAAAAPPAALDRILRQGIVEALETGDYVDHRRMDDWAGRVDDLIDQLMATTHGSRTQAAVVLDLVPELIGRLERAVEHTDDDGHIGMLLDRAVELLGAAAVRGKPDPAVLGQLIARLDLDSEYAEISPPAGALAEALAEDGLAAYWSILEGEWAELKALRPTERRGQHQLDDVGVHRWKLRRRLVARAREQGDVDSEIAILAKTLTNPSDYLELARVCRDDGRLAEAASSIDEALWLFSPPESFQLVRDGAPILAEAGQTERALGLLWEQFTHRPSVESYDDIFGLARSDSERSFWRDRAFAWLERLRRGEAPEAQPPAFHGQTASARAADVLVELSLAIDDLQHAWDVAKESKLSRHVWRRLARATETSHAADSIRVYQMLADQAVARRDKNGYREAVDLVTNMKRLDTSTESNSAINTWIADLRAKHRAKRSFIAMLDRALS